MQPTTSENKNNNLSTAQTSPDQNSCFAFSSNYSFWFLSPIKHLCLSFGILTFHVHNSFYFLASISSNWTIKIKRTKDFLPAFMITLVCVEFLKFRFFMYDLVAKFVCCFAFPSPATSSCFCSSSIQMVYKPTLSYRLRIKIVGGNLLWIFY